jgi:hypothetical protein
MDSRGRDVGIFKRKNRHAEPESEPDQAMVATGGLEEAAAHEDPGIPEDEVQDYLPEDWDEDGDAEDFGEPQDPPFDRTGGPFDADEVQEDGSRLDLGALLVPAIPGMQVNLEVDEAAQTVNAVQVALDGSYLQLQAFAAPRSFGVWAGIRAEIADSITAQGGSAEVVDGPLGRELTATMPNNGPAVRFLGVDGPRWFLRAVVSGPAATDEQAAVRLVEAVRSTVVVRGGDAMAPRELLPLRMPQVAAAEPARDQPQPGQSERSADDINPFERGPEITEVR